MAAVPINIRGRQPDVSLVDDLAAMLDELYADIDAFQSAEFVHDMLSDTHEDSVEATVARGDLIIGQIVGTTTTVKWQQKSLGTSGHFIKSDGTDVVYAAIQETDITDGSLLARNAADEDITGQWSFADDVVIETGNYLRGGTMATPGSRLIGYSGTTVFVGDAVANNNTIVAFYTGFSQRGSFSNSAFTVTVPVRGQTDSASLPTYSHTTDTNTGMYFNNADGLLFSCGGTLRMTLNTTGLSVGATTAPTVKLDVFNDGLTTTNTPTLRIANTTAATSGVARQYSGSLVFSGTAWDTDGAGSSKTSRASIQLQTNTGASPGGGLLIALDDEGSGFVNEFLIGKPASGENPRFAIRDGNLQFRNSSRGLFFSANPLTDATPSSHSITATTTGTVKVTPWVDASATEGYLEIEHNAAAISAGTIPALAIRGFDQSTSTPIMHIRHRAVSNGTAANGFGSRSLFQASSSTTTNQDAGALDCVWTDATHATRTAAFDFYLVNSAAALARKFRMLASGVFYGSAATFLIGSLTTLNNGAGAGAGTLTNAPTAGDPTKWIAIDDNGTTRYIPTWT
jgi:hypothetical protein